jgi:hypothetical protein
MKIEIEVSDELISNLLSCAFEGGSNYWLKSTRCELNGDSPSRADRTLIPLEHGGVVICTLQDEPYTGKGVEYRLTRASIEHGLVLMRDKHPKHFGDAIDESEDAITGDVFLQLCLFGEVVYG